MLGIVERILAALIILALLTLLIILAFPVPPRPNVGAPPTSEPSQEASRQPAQEPTRPAAPPGKAPDQPPADAPAAAKQPPAKVEPPAPTKTVERLSPSAAPAEPRRPTVTSQSKTRTERVIVESRVETRRRVTEVPKRRAFRRAPWLVDCDGDDCDDCCCPAERRVHTVQRSRPYWAPAEPAARPYLVERSVPYWAEPRRRRLAQIPVGACPE